MKSSTIRTFAVCIFTAALFLFTLYAALDTFVIERVFETVGDEHGTGVSGLKLGGAAETEEDREGPAEETAEESVQAPDTLQTPAVPVVTDSEYRDANTHIVITRYREYGTDIYVADVTLSGISSLKTAFAKNSYGRNVTASTSDTAEANGAVLAINGDYYGSRERGYVLRNGRLYRSSGTSGQEDLVIYSDGSFSVIDEGKVSAKQLLDGGALQVFSFGPGLVSGGEITVGLNDEVGKAMASNPRTAIGMIEPLHYLFVVSDGRTAGSEGLSLYELAEFMKELRCSVAYNLDGGGSSTIYFNGEVLNKTTSNGWKISERKVSDIVYVG